MDGREVQRELDELAAALGRPVSLDAPDGALLAYSTQGAGVDPVRVQAILARRVPDAVLAYQRSRGVDTADGPVRLPANPALGMTARTCVPVRAGRHLAAYLWVLDLDAPLDGPAVAAARSCAARLADLLGPHDTDTLLAELLTDRPRADLVLRHAEELRFVAVASTAVRAGERSPAPDADPPATVAPSALGSAAANGRRLFLSAAGPAVPSAPFHVTGVSPAFRADPGDPGQASRLAARAIVAADCAAADPALPALVGWDDLGVHRRLLLTTGPDSWPEPMPIGDDDRSADMLRHTLEVYLDNAGDAARTIAALNIHRTTFYYRLDRLTTHHGIRLDDGLARTEHHLALKTRRLAAARDAYGWTPGFLARLREPAGEPVRGRTRRPR